MHDYENTATGIIYRQLKRLNKDSEIGSNCPQALKLILNQNFQKEYLQSAQEIDDVESRTQKRIKYNKIKDVQEEETQKKEAIFQKFLQAVDKSKKYADPKLYRAPLKVKTIQLSQCIEESSSWFKQKTKEVIQKDNYINQVDKFSFSRNQALPPQQFNQQISTIDEQIQEELENTSNIDISGGSQSNQLISNQQKYYLMNNFPLQNNNNNYFRPTTTKSGVLNSSRLKKQQSVNQTDQSTTNQTDSQTLHQQLYKKLYQNDYSQIEEQIGKLQKMENEKEAHNVLSSQNILASKIAARNMDRLFNIESKEKRSIISSDSFSHSKLHFNKSEKNIQIQGKNIHQWSQNYIKQNQTKNDCLSTTINILPQTISIEQNEEQKLFSQGQSPVMQPRMRLLQTSQNFSLERPQSTNFLRRPQSGTVLKRPKSAQNINEKQQQQQQQLPIKVKIERPQSAQPSLFAQMSSFPHRSTKKMTIKKGLIKRAQSANPKIKLKNINQDNLFTFVPIKYTNIRQEFQQSHNSKESASGNFFFSTQNRNHSAKQQLQQQQQQQLNQQKYLQL